ncbi:hypothetical protein DL98DRAFT_589855 [Cadophora sp. DSE1049]|nr:hypothetical protein DL98DRAFT_589855 [Cadophora sp. DSE1049]
MSLINTFTAVLLIASLTSAGADDVHAVQYQDRLVEKKAWRGRRQNLVDLPSWTSPAFCTETGQIKDMASLMVHPPPSKILDYTSLCSEVLRPTRTISITSTLTGDSAILVTSTSTLSISTTTSEYSHSTTTALCPLPTLSHLIRCAIPALGFSKNLMYYRTNLSGIECHELCLGDGECRSFQVVPQTDRLEDGKGGLRYNRCNVYKTGVDGNVSEVGDRDGPMFWDRGCGELVDPGCGKKLQKQKRDRDSKCCRLERLPNVRPEKANESGPAPDQQDSPTIDSEDEGSLSDLDDEIRVERGYVPDGLVGEVLPIDVDESIRVESAEVLDIAVQGTLPLETGEEIRVEKRSRPYRLPLPESDDESPEEAAENGYKLPFPSEDSGNRLAAVNDEEVRPMRQDFPSRTVPRGAKWYKIPIPQEDEDTQTGQKPGPGKRNSPSRPARTPSPHIPSWYKIPVAEGDTTYKLPAPEAEDNNHIPEPDTETIRVERRDEEKGPSDPLMTPAPELPAVGEGGELDAEKGIRVEKRAPWTTPDFLTTFFPLFITLACSCLISSAAPVVTSSVTEVKQLWNYTTVSLSSFGFLWGSFERGVGEGEAEGGDSVRGE